MFAVAISGFFTIIFIIVKACTSSFNRPVVAGIMSTTTLENPCIARFGAIHNLCNFSCLVPAITTNWVIVFFTKVASMYRPCHGTYHDHKAANDQIYRESIHYVNIVPLLSSSPPFFLLFSDLFSSLLYRVKCYLATLNPSILLRVIREQN